MNKHGGFKGEEGNYRIIHMRNHEWGTFRNILLNECESFQHNCDYITFGYIHELDNIYFGNV